MATSWGIDHINNAGEIIGTSSKDVRHIWHGLYSPGVVSGCNVTTSTTAMTYTVALGVAVIRMVFGENVIAPVPAATLTVSPNTGTTARTDIVYVIQNTGALNTVSLGVAEGTAIPKYSQALATFSTSAGATTTSQSFFQGSVPYSVPYGANLGLFYKATDTSTANIAKGSAVTVAAGSFTLSTDRKCVFMADLNISARRPDNTAAVGFDNSAFVTLKVQVLIDGVWKFSFETPGLSQAWGMHHFEEYYNLKAGQHSVTFKYFYDTTQGPGLIRRHYSGTNGSTGNSFAVRDGGFWESVA